MKRVREQHSAQAMLLRRELPPEKQALITRRLREGWKRPDISTASICRSGSTEAPLSYGQQRFWFLEQLEPGQPVYHVPVALRLGGPVDYQAAASSFTEIVRRHETLRTVFHTRDGNPVQVVTPPRPVPLPVIDLQHLNGDKQALDRSLTEEAARPFDLTRDLMLRAALFRTAPETHVLLLTMHHIASDAWSINLLLDEWTELYSAQIQRRTPELPELPVQYVDFATWQRQSVESQTRELGYWKQQLGDGPPPLELPAEYARPSVPSNHGGTRSLVLGRELSASLARLSREAGTTKFMTLLAAFDVLLHRYCGQEEIVVGSPMSTRSHQQTESLIGLFLNVCVLRVNTSGDPAFRELLDRVRKTALDAYAHQDIPFEKVVEELQPARDTGRTPLFQVMFTLQEASMPITTLPAGLRMEAFDFDLDVSPFDLTLLVRETDQELAAIIEYKTDLFSAEAVDRMLGHFRTLLEGIVENPDRPISDLPLLTAHERTQLLAEFNPPPADYPREKCLHHLFEEQAARTPRAVAVKFGCHSLTYQELNERANQVADYLPSPGPEKLVGICMERSLDMIVSLLAILKAGCAYVPFEPDEPPERLTFKVRDAAVEVLLTHQTNLEHLNHLPIKIICLDRDQMAIGRCSRSNPSSSARPANLVYAIYTSGSTGKPRGVLVNHRSLVNHMTGFASRFGLGPADRVLQFAPLSFDVSAEEIFSILLTGGTLVLRPAGLAVSIADFHPFVVNEKLTVLNLPTPYWNEWMTAMEEGKLRLPASLRLVVVGSDTVTAQHYARWRKLTRPGVRWCNAYGTTEATITSTIYEPESDEPLSTVPIGRPTANSRVYILDPRGCPVPIGIPGEIYIGGVEVARGYLNRPDAMAATFVPDPFSPQTGAFLNRTGDFGRWRADGNIEFLGRRDNQVKIRGFRIELVEVEAALSEHPTIKEAVVLPREDVRGEKVLVAYLVAKQNSAQLTGKLLQFLKQRLPPYMIPAAFVPLTEIPRFPNGKVDFNALPAHGSDRPDLEEGFVAPRDSLEEKLANVWRQVLGLDKVGVHDNFFNLGGHSLLAVRLFAEIEKLTGWNLPVLTLFQSPTIKELADIIRRTQSSEQRSSILTVQPHGTRPPLFLVHGAGGGMLWGYANLAKHLGADQPVYVFNSQGAASDVELTTIEEMAGQYVRELRAFQPHGPYHLGGYCFGGLVAYEMAQQLVAEGQEVALLGLMNAMPPNSSFEKMRLNPLSMLRFARNSWYWLRYFLYWTPERRRSFIRRKLRISYKWLWQYLKMNGTADIAAEDELDLSAYSEDRRRLWNVHVRASISYQPRSYPRHVTVFRTRFHPFFCSFDPTYGWTEFAPGRVTVRLVPGAHESILDEPHVETVAAELRNCLSAPH
jgi:amino acid adenylation domain-containing protein